MPERTIEEQDEDTVFIRRGDVEVQVTIFTEEPHEGYVRIVTGPGSVPRTYPLRTIK